MSDEIRNPTQIGLCCNCSRPIRWINTRSGKVMAHIARHPFVWCINKQAKSGMVRANIKGEDK